MQNDQPACAPSGLVPLTIRYGGGASLYPRLHAFAPPGQKTGLPPRLRDYKYQ